MANKFLEIIGIIMFIVGIIIFALGFWFWLKTWNPKTLGIILIGILLIVLGMLFHNLSK